MQQGEAAARDERVVAETLTRVERDALAAEVAPLLRRGAVDPEKHPEYVGYVKARKRPIKVVPRAELFTAARLDDKVTREVTGEDLQKGLLAAKKIEIEVDEETRPKEAVCVACGKLFCLRSSGPVAEFCGSCPCQFCGKALSRSAAGRSRQTGRRACMKCKKKALTQEQRSRLAKIAKETLGALTPEQRSERARRANASMSAEQRSERASRINASVTSEQRAKATREANARMTEDQRAAKSARLRAARTSEQRAQTSREMNARLTPEQRSEKARKCRVAKRCRLCGRAGHNSRTCRAAEAQS